MYYTLHNLWALDSQNTVVGPKGSGKTTLAIMYAALALAEGKRLYTNFGLYDFWPDIVARIRFGSRYSKIPPHELREYYKDVMSRAFRYDDISDLYEERVPRRRGENPEGKMLCVFDESSIRLNSRTYSERSASDKAKYGNSVRTTQFFSQGRKLGFTLLFIAQNAKDLDAQYRNQAGYLIKSKNMQKEGIFGFKLPLPLFLTSYWHNKSRLRTQWWLYPKYLGEMYDSWEVFDAGDAHGLRLHLDPTDPYGLADTMRAIDLRGRVLREVSRASAGPPLHLTPLRDSASTAPTPSITGTTNRTSVQSPLNKNKKGTDGTAPRKAHG